VEIMVGPFRVGVPDFAPAACREGLANALIHRDYARLGAVYVQLHDERIEIMNPGGFPEGVRLDNLLVTPPRPRNPLLADAMKRAGVVERTGRGIDAVFASQLRSGRPAPSYQRSDALSVSLVLPGGEANLDFIRLVVEQEHAGRPVGVDGLLLLNALWQERVLSTDEAARLIQKTAAEARAVLGRLVEEGLIEASGETKARVWRLSAAVYRRLGQAAGYIRQRGIEPLRQEQMVLEYARQHGRVTRADVIELCMISPNQAYEMLRKLVRSGRLVRQGTGRRNTWYTAV
jgi:ATP-dependent DNA helicase RecG